MISFYNRSINLIVLRSNYSQICLLLCQYKIMFVIRDFIEICMQSHIFILNLFLKLNTRI